jgi:hypothetical protein
MPFDNKLVFSFICTYTNTKQLLQDDISSNLIKCDSNKSFKIKRFNNE